MTGASILYQVFSLRLLALGFLVVTVVGVAACEDEAKPSASSETATSLATVTPTPAVPPEDLESFRAFAAQIELAIRSDDVQFFVSRAVIQELTCTEQYGSCADKPLGTVLTGIPYGLWATEMGAPVPPQEFSGILGSFLEGGRGDLADEYGSGAPSLYALAEIGSGARLSSLYRPDERVFMALATAIVPLAGGAPPARRADALLFAKQSGQWVFLGAISSGNLYASWLSGSCADCYDYWERWEGSAAN